MKVCLALVVLAGALSCSQVLAALPYSDSFESFNRGALDANIPLLSGGVNNGPNGGPGNPWWGQFAQFGPNFQVVASENGVVPHSGTNMIRGNSVNDGGDAEFVNIAYRFNRSNVYSGSIIMDWWFFDTVPTNQDQTQFQDSAGFAYYSGVPTNKDYATGSDPGTSFLRVAIGGAIGSGQDGTYDPTVYQAQIEGSSSGYDADGWFNTTTTRSNGWHHARIVMLGSVSNSAPVQFFIDDLINPTLTNSTSTALGFNCMEFQGFNAASPAYYDDVTFDAAPAEVLNIATDGSNVIITYPSAYYTLQSSTNLAGPNFGDVTGASSPYTNAISATPHFFRLRK
jgi:hypothetical protein